VPSASGTLRRAAYRKTNSGLAGLLRAFGLGGGGADEAPAVPLEGVTEFGFLLHYALYAESDHETRAAFEEVGSRVGLLHEGELLPQLWNCRSCGWEYLLQDLPIGSDAFLGLPVCSHCPTWGWDRVRPVEQSV